MGDEDSSKELAFWIAANLFVMSRVIFSCLAWYKIKDMRAKSTDDTHGKLTGDLHDVTKCISKSNAGLKICIIGDVF